MFVFAVCCSVQTFFRAMHDSREDMRTCESNVHRAVEKARRTSLALSLFPVDHGVWKDRLQLCFEITDGEVAGK